MTITGINSGPNVKTGECWELVASISYWLWAEVVSEYSCQLPKDYFQ